MGLDMYAFRVQKENAISETEVKKDAEGSSLHEEEIYYWRKHHDLHGWMENLYNQKSGTEVFNCEHVRLTSEDLDALENDVKNNKLPATIGFFFGNYPPDDDSKEGDLGFIEKARQVISEGDCVYYYSWW